LLWLYTGDAHRPSIKTEIEKTLAKLVPGGPTTERSEFETCVLVYFCADRQGVESMKNKVAGEIGYLIYQFEEEDMDGDFATFVENVYDDIPAKDDPLRIQVTVETLKRLWRLNLLWPEYDDDSDDDSDKDAPGRILALIEANEPSAWKMLTNMLSIFRKAEPGGGGGGGGGGEKEEEEKKKTTAQTAPPPTAEPTQF
jgi:hypothetical protein